MLDAINPAGAPLQRQLDSQREQSLNYQILRRTLNIQEPAPSTPKLAEAAETPAAPPTEASPSRTDAAEQAFVDQARFRQQTGVSSNDMQIDLNAHAPKKTDPLVLDIAGNGFSTRGAASQVLFDLDGDGRLDRISAPSGDDALLAWDRNGNGRIDDGRELFGDQHGAANGFAELARFDDNGDGRIDANDPVFDQLLLLHFSADGQQQLQSLKEAGIRSIDLNARDLNQALGTYDEIAQIGRFEFEDGRSGVAADLLLAQWDA